MGELDIENRTDRVTFKGDVVPTNDQAGRAILSDKSLERLSELAINVDEKIAGAAG